MKLFLFLAALNGFLAVALGAFGAHGLEGKIPDKYLNIWKTGVTYQMFHAGGLLAVALLIGKTSIITSLSWSGWLFVIGIVLFSGSLYVLSLTQIGVLGAITPLGGVAFLAGWVLLMIHALKL